MLFAFFVGKTKQNKSRIHLDTTLLPCSSLPFWAHLLGRPCAYLLGSPPGSSLCAAVLGVGACGALAAGRQVDLVHVL